MISFAHVRDRTSLGKTVRFYWSTEGEPILKRTPHPATGNLPKVPKTDGCRPCMDLPEEFPSDIDYARYEEETENILTDLGFHGDILKPMKRIRITKANRSRVLATWATAA